MMIGYIMYVWYSFDSYDDIQSENKTQPGSEWRLYDF